MRLKTCNVCQGEIPLKLGEGARRYARRITCSRRCAGLLKQRVGYVGVTTRSTLERLHPLLDAFLRHPVEMK